MELIKGRPANEADRLDKEIRVYDLLDQLGMEYYRTDHEPATTMEVCNDIDKHLYARTFYYATDRKHNSIFL